MPKKIITRKHCDVCKVGEIKSTGNAFSNSVGTYYEHKCNECDNIQTIDQCYPNEYIKYSKKEITEVWE